MNLLSKSALRLELSISRSNRSTSELGEIGEALGSHDWAQIVHGTAVGCYANTDEEPSTSVVRKKLNALGLDVYLPIIKDESGLEWGRDCAPYQVNKFGIAEPTQSEITTAELSSIIIPSLATDIFGNRLGKGAGFYDRALSMVPRFQAGGPLRIALVFDEEVLEHIPAEPHDQRVDLIVTPDRIIKISES